jgi:hypothetical protein
LNRGLRVVAYLIVGLGLALMVAAALGAWGLLPMASRLAVPVTPAPATRMPRPTEPLLPTRTQVPIVSVDAQIAVDATITRRASATPRTPTATIAATIAPSSTPRLPHTPGTPGARTPGAQTPGAQTPLASSTPRPTHTPGAPASQTTLTATPLAATATAAPPTAPPPASGAFVVPPGERFRLGVSGSVSPQSAPAISALQVGWVMNWHVSASPAVPPGVMYAQTVRVMNGVLRPPADTLQAVAAARPGSLWLIGNEPDVPWQDGITAEQYAVLYHEAYHAIRGADPGARVAAGGIAQPTPLRLRYLDEVLAVYQARFGEPLPAQVWQIHNYMLREERGSWGVGIPPGMPDGAGKLYSIADADNLEIFKGHIWAFRRWMAERGYQGLPLVVTEFSNPMPEDYGFPPESRAAFLRETWRFFLTATDGGLGDPSDGGRLVQRWCWFSLYDGMYPADNLTEADLQTWTPLGRAWLGYVGAER